MVLVNMLMEIDPLPMRGSMVMISVGERSNFKKFPTHTQDHGDA